MKQLTKAIPILSVIMLFYISGCQHKSNIQPTNTNNSPNHGDTALCFERDILPIFKTNCGTSGCHDAASHEEGYIFTSWGTITSKEFTPGNPGKTELYEKITENDPDKIMPKPPMAPLTTTQKELIRRWIAEGAKNTTNCGSLCDSNSFTYAANIKPLADKYCKGCHSTSSAQKGIILDTYDGLRNATLNGKLLDAINHRTGAVAMPYNVTKLSDCEIRQFEKWAAGGALNN